MPQITASGIKIEWETLGDPARPPVMPSLGLGAQLTLWPEEFVEVLVTCGAKFHEIAGMGHDLPL